MPTPRHITEITKRAGGRGSGASAPKPGEWSPGVVLSAVSDATPVYQVYTAFGLVEAVSVIDAALVPNSPVWVVRDSDGKYLVAGAR